MILVTVGSQLPFDRLIRWMDAIAADGAEPVVAQCGTGSYAARHLETRAWIAPAEFDGLVRAARLIVSHAGIGSVLSAQKCGKPIVLVPRRADLKEHRNDHQLATAGALRHRPGIFIAEDAEALRRLVATDLRAGERGDADAGRARLRASVVRFIEQAER